MIYNALLCLALLATILATFAGTSDFSLLRQTTLIWHKHPLTANVSCVACHSCFALGGTQGKYFRGIFSSLSFENVKLQFFFLFFPFLKSPNRDTDQLACPRREEEYLVGYCLGKKKKKGKTFRSLKSHPVWNLCYGWNSRLNFTLANCYPDTMLNKFLFLTASSTNGGAAFCQLTQPGKMRVRLAQSGVRQRLSQPLQN